MNRNHTIACSLTAALLVIPGWAHAVSFLSGPSITKATNAPLAGLLRLTTDEATRVSVSVDEGTNVWTRRFYDYATVHSIPLLGFKPGRTNQITVTAIDRHRNQVATTQPLRFITGPLPTNFPNIVLLHCDPDLMEPGYTLFNVRMKSDSIGYITIVDSFGTVVWYDVNTPSGYTADVRLLDNGNLFMPWTTNFMEMNLLGEAVRWWPVPTNLTINPHDGVPTDHGTILYLSDAVQLVSNYPTSMTISNPPLTTANVKYQKVVELSMTNSVVLNTWSPINVLDPRRIGYLIVSSGGSWDSEHSNAVIEDPRDDSLIVSMRHQDAVVKFSRATGQLRWILGPPENWGAAWQPYLLTPVGDPFVWQYAQHSPVLTPQGTLLLWDNGNYRVRPFAPIPSVTNYYSRAVEYSIDEQAMQVSQVWEYGRTNVADRLYTYREGNAQPLPLTGNVLNDFASVGYVNGAAPSPYGTSATMCRITEVTHDAIPQIVFDLAISLYANTNTTYKDVDVYRCRRIPDLYPHLAKPVGDLAVTYADGISCLEFSADNTRTYRIQVSPNLADWRDIGVAFEDEEQAGAFRFVDEEPVESPACYYRVVTE